MSKDKNGAAIGGRASWGGTIILAATDACVMASSIPAGAAAPLHSHKERETFYIISGSLEVFNATEWRTLSTGSVVDIQPQTRHAFRNISTDPVSVALVVPNRMAQFFASTGRPICTLPFGVPSPQAVRAFVSAAFEQGSWPGPLTRREAAGISQFLTAMGQVDQPNIPMDDRRCARGS
jgi:quercetin dioxygenase-like cupin family protein